MKKFLFPCILVLIMTIPGRAQQQEKDKIQSTIQELFDAYRAGDSARVADTFTRKASLQSVHKDKQGNVVLSEPVPLQKFLDYIGSGLSEVHDERLWDTEIFYDDYLATVWTKYAFYLGKKFIHCGTETFQLRKVEGNWKIFYLVDTRQLENCNVPASVK